MATRIQNPMADALADDDESPEIVVIGDTQGQKKKKKKKKKGATEPDAIRPAPAVHEHLAAVLIQAHIRGNRDRKHYDFFRHREDTKIQASATIDWFQGRCKEVRLKIKRNKLHYFDYWKKYDGNDKMQPQQKLGDIGTPWVMVFALVEDGETGEFDRLSYECVEICQRCWAADLFLDASISTTKQDIVIKLGAPYEILAKEAMKMGLLMRLKETKGAQPYSDEYMTHYTPNRFSPELKELGFASPFTSGHQQRLVQHRLGRIAGIDLLERIAMPVKEECLDFLKGSLKHGKTIRAQDIKNLMTTFGAFRPHVEHTLGPKVKLLTQALFFDNNFVVYPPEKNLTAIQQVVHDTQHAHFEKQGLEIVTTELLSETIQILEVYSDTDAAKVEVFHGTLRQFFPTHNHEELGYFKERWGKLSLVCTPYVKGRMPESEHSDTYHNEDPERRHLSAFFVPLDAIRDYFGDDIGLYTAWLRMYTKGLVYPAITGLLLFLLGNVYFDGIDDNWLSIPYSVYMSLWSVLFLNFWVRRENELKFLWGTEDLEVTEEPRANFKGVLRVNKETEREMMIHPSQSKRAVQLLVGFLFCVLLVCATGTAAFLASQLKFSQNPPSLCRFAPKHNTDLATGNRMWPSCPLYDAPGGSCENWPKGGRSDFHVREEAYGCEYWAYSCAPTAEEMQAFLSKIPAHVAARIGIDGIDAIPVENRTANSTANITAPEGYILGQDSEFECYMADRLLRENGDYGTAEWFFEWPEDSTELEKKQWGFISSFCNLVIIQVAGQLFEALARNLNEWENHRTQTEYEDMLILKNFMFQFINNYFVLFYIGYLRQIEILGSSQVCSNGSCLETLQQQLGVVFTVKTFGLQIVELIKPIVMKHIHSFQLGKRREALVNATTGAIASAGNMILPGHVADFVGMDDDDLEARKAKATRDRKHSDARAAYTNAAPDGSTANGQLVMVGDHNDDDAPEHIKLIAARDGISVRRAIERSNAEAESFLADYGSTFDDFNEMVIQYGYVALFAPAYSLAPLLALINNIIEIRVDAIKLCYATQRPQWKAQADIGSWYTVLNILGFAAVITNSTMIAFVGYKLVPMLYTAGDDAQLMQGGINARMNSTQLWMYAVGIEHFVILTRVMIIIAFSDVPAWLDEARELLQFRSARMPTAKELEEQALASAAYRKKLAGSNRVVGGNVEKFHESEKVKSSTVKVSNPLNREDL